jgi:hypothetical protein
MNGIVVCHNTGLGDYIVLNGATRCLAEKFDRVYLLCWDSRLRHVEWIYRNDDSIIPYAKPHPKSARQAMLRQNASYEEIVRDNPRIKFEPFARKYITKEHLWIENISNHGLDVDNISWPRLFYAMQNVPYEKRHTEYRLDRDAEREEALFESLNLPSKYAFVVDEGRKYSFRCHPDTTLPIVNPREYQLWSGKPYDWNATLIFDWLKVIERASELHVVDTGWFHLIKTLNLNIPKYWWNDPNTGEKWIHGTEYLNDEYEGGWIKMEATGHQLKNGYWLK